MKYLFISFLIICSSCISQDPGIDKTNKYKKALIRTRHVQSVSQNVDVNNSILLNFDLSFENQLVEINLESSFISTSELTVLNSNGLSENLLNKKISSDLFNGDLDILLNGTSIKSCLITQCNNNNCSENTLSDLKGIFSTKKVFINLTRLASDNCPGSNLNLSSNRLEIILIHDSNGPIYQGKKVKVQLINYNLTHTPKGMKNAAN